MNAPLSKKLNEVKWGEFKIGDLFEILSYKGRFDANKVQLEKQGHPYIVRTALNNGLKGFLNEDEKYLNDGNTISFGQDTATMFYQEKPYFTGDKIKILKPKYSRFGKANALFFITEMTKSFSNFSWGSTSFSVDTISDQQVSLPITPENKIDFDFMEAFIRELEEERIRELEEERIRELAAYLKVSGFDNYTLSKCESEALAHFNELKWKEFKIGDLFERVSTKKLSYKALDLPKKPVGEYTLPCLTSSFQNQGLNYYVPRNGATILKNVISIPSNSDVYRAYYQSREFTVLSDAYAIKWKNENHDFNNLDYLFSVMCINKVTDLPIYSYKMKLGGWNVVQDKYIKLPVKNDEIDYAFMESFISAVQKLVIKDVVLYADKKIAATKQAVHKNPSEYGTHEGFGALKVAEHN